MVTFKVTPIFSWNLLQIFYRRFTPSFICNSLKPPQHRKQNKDVNFSMKNLVILAFVLLVYFVFRTTITIILCYDLETDTMWFEDFFLVTFQYDSLVRLSSWNQPPKKKNFWFRGRTLWTIKPTYRILCFCWNSTHNVLIPALNPAPTLFES